MPFTRTSDGVRLFYEVTGSGETVLFAHAYLGRADVWAGQRIALASRLRIAAFDARGHGRSDAPDDPAAYSLTRFVDDLIDVLDALEVESAHLCGLSMGAETVLHAILSHPSRVKSAVLADVGTGSENPAGMRAWADEIAESFLTVGSAGTYQAILADTDLLAGLGMTRRKAVEGMRLLVESQSPHGMAYTIRGVLADRAPIYELGDRLATVTQPVLVIRGALDTPVARPSQFLVAHLPNAREVVIPGVSHVTNIQAPADFNRALSAFLREVTTARHE